PGRAPAGRPVRRPCKALRPEWVSRDIAVRAQQSGTAPARARTSSLGLRRRVNEVLHETLTRALSTAAGPEQPGPRVPGQADSVRRAGRSPVLPVRRVLDLRSRLQEVASEKSTSFDL